MKIKCSYAGKYKAIHQPKCGCNFCANMWAKVISAKDSKDEGG